MIRKILTVLVPFLAPFILYAIWNYVIRRREEAGERLRDPLSWKAIPWIWLGVAGITLAATVLVAGALFWPTDPGALYEPPRFEDGRRVPGHFGN